MKFLPSFILIIQGLFATTDAASLAALQKRESGLTCFNGGACKSYYTTGSAQCAAGYQRTTLVAKGYPLGSYCERQCTADEEKKCRAEQCSSNECFRYPKSIGLCRDALRDCGGSAAMSKEICNFHDMKQVVLYRDGVCSVDLSVRKPPPAKILDPFTGNVQYRVASDDARNDTVDSFLTCHGIAGRLVGYAAFSKGITALDKSFHCHSPSRGAWFCDRVPVTSLDELRTKGEAVCKSAQENSKASDLRYTFGPEPSD